MTDKNILVAFAEKFETTQKLSKEMIDFVFENILHTLASGTEDKITLPGFGIFKKTIRKARKGRNPQTGAEIQIAESTTMTFSVATKAKEALNVKSKKASPAPSAAPAAKKKK